jgi:manganese/iron transport system substrate-binding protein
MSKPAQIFRFPAKTVGRPSRKRRPPTVLLGLVLLGLLGCQATTVNQATEPTATGAQPPDSSSSQPLVVATSSVLCDLTRQIAAETIQLKCLVAGGTDPHLYTPTPADRKAIDAAKLVLYSGYDFEPDLIRLIQASPNPAVKVAVAEIAVPQPQTFLDEGKMVADPHVFHSAANGAAMAEVIRQKLTTLLPSQAARYNSNAQPLIQQLKQLDAWITTQVATIPAANRKLVTTHDAFGYYAKRYNIPIEGALQGITTEEAPTAKRVTELVREIKSTQVPTIFAETTINPKLIATVAKEAQVTVAPQGLFSDGLGEPGSAAATYQTLLTRNTQTIVEGLGGKFTPFPR